jgi:hypothetical protein
LASPNSSMPANFQSPPGVTNTEDVCTLPWISPASSLRNTRAEARHRRPHSKLPAACLAAPSPRMCVDSGVALSVTTSTSASDSTPSRNVSSSGWRMRRAILSALLASSSFTPPVLAWRKMLTPAWSRRRTPRDTSQWSTRSGSAPGTYAFSRSADVAAEEDDDAPPGPPEEALPIVSLSS